MSRAALICGLVLIGCGASDRPPGEGQIDASVPDDGDQTADGAGSDSNGDALVCASTSRTLEPFVDGSMHSSVVLDPAGVLHVSFVAPADGDLRYGTLATDGTWNDETIDPFAAGVAHSALVLDPANGAHISYTAT